MAEDVVIARFKADLDGVRAEFEKYIATLNKVEKEEKEVGKEATASATKVESAAKKRTAAIKSEETELARLKKARKDAFTVEEISRFNAKINETKNRISTLKGTTDSVGASLKSMLAGGVAGIAAAFSVQAVLNFGKKTIDAFLEAEENANKLKFAIVNIGGEGEIAFERLIRQASKFQEITIFSDDQIQQAQASLATFGLTSEEIEKAIPKILDYASATKQDLAGAVEQVGAALEGTGKELKKYEIFVSATASRQENLNTTMNGFVQFAGAATDAAKTLSGQLKVMDNKVGELEESIGSRLADDFVIWKVAALSAIKFVIEAFDSAEAKILRKKANSRELLRENIEANIGGDAAISGLTIEDEAKKKLIETGKKLNEIDEVTLRARRNLQDIIKEGIRENKKAFELAEKKVTALVKEKGVLVQTAGVYNDIIKAEENKTKTTKAATSAVKELTDAEKKAAAAAADLRVATTEVINPLEKITDVDVTPLENIFLEATKGVQSFRTAVQEASKDVNKLATTEFEDNLNKANQARVDSTKTANKEIVDSDEETTKKIIATSIDLINTLAQLAATFSNAKIDAIKRETDAQLAALDIQDAAITKSLEKRQISEKEAEAQRAFLAKKRVEIEDNASKKERELKRKAAILDKAGALAQIIINTQQGASKAYAQGGTFGPLLAALVIAAGAAQAAIVLATPIPYAKGTKDAEGGLSLVGEHGPERMMLPQGTKIAPARQSRQHAKVFDAIIDDRFEDYVLKQFVTPALEKQKAKYESNKQDSFAKSISESLILNNMLNTDPIARQMKKGQRISNVEELADAIARRTEVSPYRR